MVGTGLRQCHGTHHRAVGFSRKQPADAKTRPTLINITTINQAVAYLIFQMVFAGNALAK